MPVISVFLSLVAPIAWAIAFLIHGIFVGKRINDIYQAALTGTFGGIFGGFVAAICHVFVVALSFGGADPDQLLGAVWGVVGVTLEI